MRKFLADTISDRFPVDRTDPRHIEWFLDEAAKNDTAYIARFVGLMASLEWSGRVAPDQVSDARRLSGRRDGRLDA